MIDLQPLREFMDEATANNKRTVAFNYLILKHYKELDGIKPEVFCRELGMKPTAVAQYNMMLRLARYMDEMKKECDE